MIFEAIAGFLEALPPYRCVAGLDLGDKTIGVAISDLRRSVATPFQVIRRVKFTLDAAVLLDVLMGRQAVGSCWGCR